VKELKRQLDKSKAKIAELESSSPTKKTDGGSGGGNSSSAAFTSDKYRSSSMESIPSFNINDIEDAGTVDIDKITDIDKLRKLLLKMQSDLHRIEQEYEIVSAEVIVLIV
ncbi:MAG: hypothetical protein AAF503_15550, partial [Pseudomonadota bacterium]